MSTHLTVKPIHLGPSGFSDGAPHRAGLHAVYNQYRRCGADLGYQREREAAQMLVQPLFMTSFLIDDFLADQDFFGASQVVITSASSKTSYSLAHQLKLRQKANLAKPQGAAQRLPKVLGLTSQSNAVFVNGMGCYDQVLTYQDIAQLGQSEKSVLVDMAGNAELRRQVHEALGERLSYSCSVGGTHWDALSSKGQAGNIPGPKPTLFFAPAQIKKRNAEWGAKELQMRMGRAWLAFQPALDQWMHVVEGRGEQAVLKVYTDMLAGKAKADHGYVLGLD